MLTHEWLLTLGKHAAFVGLLSGCAGETPTEEASTRRAVGAIDAGTPEGTGPITFGPDFGQNPIEYEPNTTAPSTPTSIAFDGDNYLVAWQFWGNTEWVQLARVSPRLDVLDTTPIELGDNDNTEPLGLKVASDGTDFVAVYRACDRSTSDRCNYRLKRIRADGVVLDPVGIPLTSADHATNNLQLASTGQGYLAVWSEQDVFSYSDPYRMRAAVIDDTATSPIVKTTDITDTHSSTVGCYVHLALAANDTNYLVTWTTRNEDDYQSGFDIAAIRITTDGTVIPADPASGFTKLVLGAASNSQLALGSDGKDFLITWTDFAENSTGRWYEAVYGARITSEGVFTNDSPFALTTSELNHRNLSVTFDGRDYLATWFEATIGSTYDGYRWHGSHIASDGTIRAPADFPLVDGVATSGTIAPTCEGSCLLAWSSTAFSQDDNVSAAFYDSDVGTVAQAASTVVSLQQRSEASIRTICASEGCVSLWSANARGPSGGPLQLISSGLESNGQLRPNTTWTVAEPHDSLQATLATDGNDYLVAWWDKEITGSSQITVQRLDKVGKPVENGRFTVSTANAWPSNLMLASTGNGYLLAYREERNNGNAILGMTLNADGSVKAANTFTIDMGSNRLFPTHLVATSTTYLLGFRSDDGATVARLDVEGHLINGSIRRLLPPNATTSLGAVSFYDIATNGREFLVSWCDASIPTDSAGRCEPHGTTITADGTLGNLTQPLGPTTNNGLLVWDGNAYVWVWSFPTLQSNETVTQHFTELLLDVSGNVRSMDSAFENRQVSSTVSMSGTDLLWTYTVPSGHPEIRFYGPTRIHRRLLSGLCFGDPKGDANGNGRCDSKESPTTPPDGTAGSSGTAGGTSGSGGTSSYVPTNAGASTVGSAGASFGNGGAHGTLSIGSATSGGTFPAVSGAGGTNKVITSTQTALGGADMGAGTNSDPVTSNVGGVTGTASRTDKHDTSLTDEHYDVGGGCNCRMASSKSASSGWCVAGLIAGLIARGQRRRRRSSTTR